MRQNALPTILLVEPDDDTRPLLTHNFQSRGYRVIVALDQKDAIERTRNGHERPDIILLNQFGRLYRGVHHDRTIDSPRVRFSDSHPIVVMAERYGEEMEGKSVRVGDSEYVTYLEDGQQLMNFLHYLCRDL